MYQVSVFGNYHGVESDPGYAKKEEKGRNAVCVLALGENEIRDAEPIGSKAVRAIIENYIRRPSLRDEALDHILEFAHNGVMVAQRPNARVQCGVAVLLMQKDSFRWAVNGKTRVYHFVNGQIAESSGRPNAAALGETADAKADMLPENRMAKGENSFLLCSESLCRYLSDREIEETLSRAESGEAWQKALRALYESRSEGEPCAIFCVFAPSKRKRRLKKPVFIAIIAVLVLAIAFFAMGAIRRRNEKPPMPDGQPVMGTRPPEPTRPDQPGPQGTQPPEPTEPPMPELTEEI